MHFPFRGNLIAFPAGHRKPHFSPRSDAQISRGPSGMEEHKRDFQLSSDVQRMSDGLALGRREEADIEGTKMKRS